MLKVECTFFLHFLLPLLLESLYTVIWFVRDESHFYWTFPVIQKKTFLACGSWAWKWTGCRDSQGNKKQYLRLTDTKPLVDPASKLIEKKQINKRDSMDLFIAVFHLGEHCWEISYMSSLWHSRAISKFEILLVRSLH